MGKGYNNFMSKKPFHPASKENIKRVWMAEQRSIDAKKKEEEMRLQYEKEQDLYNNRLLVTGSDSKDKLSLNFMYEAPPGVRKENAKEIDTEAEPQYKFEWQRNAPRESFAKNNMEIRDQPFGIQVRNVRCLKCHKWGHVNTDRECPLYNASSSSMTSTDQSLQQPDQKSMSSKSGDQQPPVKMEPNELIASMKDDQGLALKRSLYGNYGPESMKNNSHHEMISATAATSNPEQEFLESLSSKQKKLLLKKLQSLNRTTTKSTKSADRRKHSKKSKSKKKKSKKSKGHHKSSKDSSESSSSSNSDSEASSESKSSTRRNHKHRRHHRSSSKTDHGDHHRKHRTDHHNDHRDDRHSKSKSHKYR